MSKEDVFDRLTKVIENVSRKKRLTPEQISTIKSLVESIREGDTISDEKLMRYFDQIASPYFRKTLCPNFTLTQSQNRSQKIPVFQRRLESVTNSK